MNREELLLSLNKLKAGYISILNQLDVMKNWGKIQLEALYATQIGKYEVELLKLKIELKSLKKKIQLVHQAVNIGQDPNFLEIETAVLEMVSQAYREINEAKEKVNFGKAVLSHLGSPEDSMELRRLYRSIAKVLHPDVNPSLTEEQKEIWHLFQSAFKNGDLDKMEALKIVYEEHLKKAEETTSEISEEDILLQTAALKQGIKLLEEQKKQLEKEFPFSIAENIRDEDWIVEKQNVLKKEIEDFEAAVKEKSEIYELLKETYGT